MSVGTTPKIALLLGEDSAENENWQKLDRALAALYKQVIPDSVIIQGDLEVTGNIQGDSGLTIAGQATFQNGMMANSLTVGPGDFIAQGRVSLPPSSLDGGALFPGTGIYTAQTGFAQTAQLTLTQTYQDLGEIILSPPDDPNRWELVIASMQFQIGMGADNVAGVTQSMQVNLKRGQTTTSVVQSRLGNYTLTRAGYIELPMTMVRITKPVNTADGVSRWALEAHLSTALTAPSITRMFTQLSVVQFL